MIVCSLKNIPATIGNILSVDVLSMYEFCFTLQEAKFIINFHSDTQEISAEKNLSCLFNNKRDYNFLH